MLEIASGTECANCHKPLYDGKIQCPACQAVKATERQSQAAADIRTVIFNALSGLNAGLRGFEHTTHGAMTGGTPEEVGMALVACIKQPTAFTVSELSQVINKLLKSVS